MGIYDREYYRREGPSFLDSFHLRGQVCKWLIIVNIAVYAVQLLTRREMFPGMGGWWLAGPFTDALALNVDAVLDGQIWRLLTYAFLHDVGSGFPPQSGFYWHIIFNMWFLWMFGSEIEELYGPKEFLSIYLLSAILGGVAFTALGAMTASKLCVGASGAVTCVMVLYALHFPRRTILLFFVIPVPVWLLVGFQVAQDTFLFVDAAGPNVLKSRTAVTVHLAGAAFALLYYKLEWRLTGFWSGLRRSRLARSRPKLRVYRGDDEGGEPVAVSAPPAVKDVDEQLEAKLDAVLEKVARSGKESLTDSERQILMRASEIYRKRRS